MDRERYTGPYISTGSYWLLIDAGKGRIIVFSSYLLLSLHVESTTSMVTWTRLVKFSSHKTQQKDMSLGKRFIKRKYNMLGFRGKMVNLLEFRNLIFWACQCAPLSLSLKFQKLTELYGSIISN